MTKSSKAQLTEMLLTACKYIRNPDSITDTELDDIHDWYVWNNNEEEKTKTEEEARGA